MEKCIFTVELRDDKRWHICESGVARSLASFGLKDDAVEYAHGLVPAGVSAEVVVVQPIGRRREQQAAA